MPFVSFAQNYEDVILWRALKNVKNGCYVDVGANDPVADSVTKSFYDKGWRGLNIEPVGAWYNKIVLDRPDDINLRIAVGREKGKLPFYEIADTGLSTMDSGIAKRHAEKHGFDISQYDVPVLPLSDVIHDYITGDIHFLKIDVEGYEQNVLMGLDLSIVRPWIIVVESTLPNTQLENYQDWENILTENRYHFVYFDGLNRFYVANEKNELDKHFDRPPNHFDNFERIGKIWADQRGLELTNELASITNQFNALQSDHHILITSKEDGREKLLSAIKQLSEANQSLDGKMHKIIEEIRTDKQKEINALTDKWKSRIERNELLLAEYDAGAKAMLADHVALHRDHNELIRQKQALVKKQEMDFSTLNNLQHVLATTNFKQQKIEASLLEAHAQTLGQKQRYDAVIHSTSWKLTRPFRGIMNIIRAPLRVLANIGLFLVRKLPWLRPFVMVLLLPVPTIRNRLRNFASDHSETTKEFSKNNTPEWNVQASTKNVDYWLKTLRRGA